MTYRIATYPGLNDEPVLLRHNDGALVILRGDGDGAVPVLIVPRVAEVARNVAYTAPDLEQEAFAARVVALLNGESQ